jgi:hypothetical protein
VGRFVSIFPFSLVVKTFVPFAEDDRAGFGNDNSFSSK